MFRILSSIMTQYSSGWILMEGKTDVIAYNMKKDMRTPYGYEEHSDGGINRKLFGGLGTVSIFAGFKNKVLFENKNDALDENVEVEVMYHSSLEEEACSSRINSMFKRVYPYNLYGHVLIFAYKKTGDKQTPVRFALRIVCKVDALDCGSSGECA